MSPWPIIGAGLLLLALEAALLRELRRWTVAQLAVRLRAQAKPLIDRRLEHLSGQLELPDLAAILAMDLTSRDTSAIVVGPGGSVVATPPAGAGGPPPPRLDEDRYARALAGDPHVTVLVRGSGDSVLVVLIPPLAWLPSPPAVVQLACDISEQSRNLDRLALTWGIGTVACACLAMLLETLLGGPWILLALLSVPAVALAASRLGVEGGAPVPEPSAVADTAPPGPRADFTGAMRRMEAAFLATKASEESMRRFVADASHELRTPLTSLGGAADVLLAGAAREPEHAERLARVIRAQSDRMGNLVEDLLTLARLDAGVELRREPVALDRLAAQHAEELALAHPERHVELHAEPRTYVDGDPERLRQILANLTANAVRHTAPGGRIAIAVERDGGTALVRVEDDGEGIELGDLQRVFERFHRGESARAAGTGTGLGLAIVRELVHAHGGGVQAETDPGSGARLTVRIPASAREPSGLHTSTLAPR